MPPNQRPNNLRRPEPASGRTGARPAVGRILARILAAALAVAVPSQGWASRHCPAGQVYLTLDTGGMQAADHIADVMRRHGVRATFFLANEATVRGDRSLEPGWTSYWRERAAEGHAFGSHTWRHWYLRADLDDGRIRYVSAEGRAEPLDRTAFCEELGAVDRAFREMTGRGLDPIWRAPGGRTTPRALDWARGCGFPRHVGWSKAGFLGDELPSDKYPNKMLLDRALRTIRDGDVLMMHLGIWSRREPFAEVFEPLVVGLKERGFCFATLTDGTEGGGKRP